MTDRPTVLIVDDDALMLEQFKRMLALEGYAVATATSADDALRWLADHVPGLILLDLRMPLMDGLALLQHLRTNSPAHATVPVVIITGDYFIAEETVADLQALGASIRYKPLWLEDLIKLAHEYLPVEGPR
jgi:CheY-like chemotaxis protein